MSGIAGHSHLGTEREGRSLVYREGSGPTGLVHSHPNRVCTYCVKISPVNRSNRLRIDKTCKWDMWKLIHTAALNQVWRLNGPNLG